MVGVPKSLLGLPGVKCINEMEKKKTDVSKTFNELITYNVPPVYLRYLMHITKYVRIKPSKSARRHVTTIDGKVLSVTKLELKFSLDHLMRMHIRKCTATLLLGMASIPSAAFVFDQYLASYVTTVQGFCRLLSQRGDTFAESDLLHVCL